MAQPIYDSSKRVCIHLKRLGITDPESEQAKYACTKTCPYDRCIAVEPEPRKAASNDPDQTEP